MEDRIRQLDDATAVRVLSAITRPYLRRGEFSTYLSPELREALVDSFGPASLPSIPNASEMEGDLARDTLRLLASSPSLREPLVAFLDGPTPEVFGVREAGAVATAVLLVLQAHFRLQIERSPKGGWKLSFEKVAPPDELLTSLVHKLLASTEAIATTRPGKRMRLFISYSQRDRPWLNRLQVHLKPLERGGIIDRWDDTRIKPGDIWKDEIATALGHARLAVLLVSADFLASDFVASHELPRLLDAAENQGVVILSLIVGPCLFETAPRLARYQAINSPSNPLSILPEGEQERVLANAARAIYERLT